MGADELPSRRPDPYRWQDHAACQGVDPDLFFPERGASLRQAKEVCGGCVVREDCLEYALAHGEKFGIWGGMSERERRRVRRVQRETPLERQCPHCDEPFTTREPRQRYCSPVCRTRSTHSAYRRRQRAS